MRTGSTLSGYFFNGTSWVLVGSGVTSTGPTRFNLDLGTGNPSAPGVGIAFDNFQVNAGTISCPCSFAHAVRGDGMKTGVLVPKVFPGTISTNFQPGCGLSLTAAAQLGGYDHFNWVQTVLSDSLLLSCPACAYPVLGELLFCFGVTM